MKRIITFKTPDVLFYAFGDLPEEDRETFTATAEKFIRHGEIIQVEIDTEKETCVVVKP